MQPKMTRQRFLLILLLALVLLLSTPLIALAQDGGEDEPPDCPAFEGSSADVRTGYYMGEGAGYFSSGQLVRAIESYTCIIEVVDGSYLPAYMARAAAYTQRRNYDAAVEDYTAAIGLDGSLLAAYNNRGIVYAAQEEYDLALADFDQVLGLNSGFAAGYSNRGAIRALTGDFQAAIDDLEQSIATSNIESIVDILTDPDRDPTAPRPEYNRTDAQAYAILGIIYSARALDNYNRYLLLTGSSGDQRIQSAAGALESRFAFELRLDDGSWLLAATFTAP